MDTSVLGQAVLGELVLGSAGASLSPSFTLDAVLQRGHTGSFTLDAALSIPRAGSFTLDATLFVPHTGSLTLNAVLQRGHTGSFTLDATLFVPHTGSLTLNAVISVARTGSFDLRAIKGETSAIIVRDTFDRNLTGDWGWAQGGKGRWHLINDDNYPDASSLSVVAADHEALVTDTSSVIIAVAHGAYLKAR